MATIGILDVKVNADLALLLSGLKKAKSEMLSFEKSINSSMRTLKKFNSVSVRPRTNLSDLKKMDDALTKSRQTISALSRLSIRPRTNTSDVRKLQAEILKLQSSISKVNNTSVSPKMSNSRITNDPSAAVGNFNRSIAGVGSAIGVSLGIREIKEYADAWTTAGNKIAAAASITGVQTRSLEELNTMANTTRSSFEATVDLYAKLVRSSSEVATSELEIAKATETVTKAFKAGGSTTQEQIAGITQLGQALGSGVLQGDELRSIRENAPLIAKAIADEFGVTIGELKKLGEEGELVSARVFKAIIGASSEIDKAFQSTTSTISDGLTKVNNAMTQYIGQADKGNGATATLVSALSSLADNFDNVADTTLKLVSVIAAAFIGRAIGGMLASLGLAIGQMRAFVAAIRAAQTAAAGASAFAGLSAAAGPIGAVLGVAAAAAIYFGTSSSDASENTEQLREEMRKLGILANDLKPKIDEAAKSLEKLAPYDLRKKLEQINAELERMKNRSLMGMLGFSDADEQTLGDIQARIDAIQRGRTTGAEKQSATALEQLIQDAEAGKVSLEEVEQRLNKIGEIKVSKGIDNLIDGLRKVLPMMKSLRDYQNVVTFGNPNAPAAAKPNNPVISEGAISERQNRAQDAWIEEQKAILFRSEKEKEIAKIMEKLLKDAKEAGQALTTAAAETAATQIYDQKQTNEVTNTTLEVIKKFESFSSKPYWDVNAFRAGFGSDTVTLDDGSIQKVTQGMTVTLDQANRDLSRRVEEFQNTIKSQIGADTFGGFNENQKAALTSIAYNYGSLPERIVEAVKSGSTETIYTAIRGLGSDNGGINKTRRASEADMFATGFGKDVKGAFESKEDFDNKLKQKQQELEFLKEETALRGTLNPLLEDYGGKLSTLQTAQELLTMAQEQETAAGRELSDVQQLLYGDLSKLTPEARAQAEAMRGLAIGQGEATEAGNRLQQSQAELRDKLEATNEFGKDVLGGFISDLREGKSATEALANALQKVADKLLDVGLDALFGTGQFSVSGGGSGVGLFSGIAKTLFGGFFADGGTPPMNKVSVVGERGPELFVPKTTGVIVPNNRLSPSVGGGTTQQIEISLKTNTDTGVITEIADARVKKGAPSIVRASVSESQKQTKNNMPGYLANAQAREI